MFKKILMLFCCMVLSFSVVGCGNASKSEGNIGDENVEISSSDFEDEDSGFDEIVTYTGPIEDIDKYAEKLGLDTYLEFRNYENFSMDEDGDVWFEPLKDEVLKYNKSGTEWKSFDITKEQKDAIIEYLDNMHNRSSNLCIEEYFNISGSARDNSITSTYSIEYEATEYDETKEHLSVMEFTFDYVSEDFNYARMRTYFGYDAAIQYMNDILELLGSDYKFTADVDYHEFDEIELDNLYISVDLWNEDCCEVYVYAD